MKRFAFWIGVVFLCPAQTQFRADVHLVNVSFIVRDETGTVIGDLTKDQIEVFEDGVPQTITHFQRSEDVWLNLGLIVDVSGSQDPFVKQHHKDLEVFLKNALKKDDRAFLLCFGNRLRLVRDFGSTPKELAEGLVKFDARKGKELHPEIGPREIRSAGTAFYDAIYYAVSEMLAPVEQGRRALIVFSDGEENSSAHHMMETVEVAQNANVVLFNVRYTDVHDGRWNSRNKYGKGVMARMAQETGGADFDARERGLEENFRQIGEQLRSSYELAYQSTNTQRDGTFHKIAIKSRRPGLTVQAKTGYYPR